MVGTIFVVGMIAGAQLVATLTRRRERLAEEAETAARVKAVQDELQAHLERVGVPSWAMQHRPRVPAYQMHEALDADFRRLENAGIGVPPEGRQAAHDRIDAYQRGELAYGQVFTYGTSDDYPRPPQVYAETFTPGHEELDAARAWGGLDRPMRAEYWRRQEQRDLGGAG